MAPNCSGSFYFYSKKVKPKFNPKSTSNSDSNKKQSHETKIESSKWERKLIKVNGEILYGFHPVLMALKSGNRKFFQIYYNEGSLRTKKVIDLAIAKNINVESVPPRTLDFLAKKSTIETNVTYVYP